MEADDQYRAVPEEQIDHERIISGVFRTIGPGRVRRSKFRALHDLARARVSAHRMIGYPRSSRPAERGSIREKSAARSPRRPLAPIPETVPSCIRGGRSKAGGGEAADSTPWFRSRSSSS